MVFWENLILLLLCFFMASLGPQTIVFFGSMFSQLEKVHVKQVVSCHQWMIAAHHQHNMHIEAVYLPRQKSMKLQQNKVRCKLKKGWPARESFKWKMLLKDIWSIYPLFTLHSLPSIQYQCWINTKLCISDYDSKFVQQVAISCMTS